MQFTQSLSNASYTKWAGSIKKKNEEKGRKLSENRLRKVCEMAHTRKVLNESLEGIPGRGGVAFGNNPNAGMAGYYGTKGSGEVWANLFNVFLEVASTNVGMELVPIIPQLKSSGSVHIVEPIYAGGRIDSTQERPEVFQVKVVKTGVVTPLNVGTTYTLKTANSGGEDAGTVVFVGYNRINGNYIFRTGQFNDNSGSAGTDWTQLTIADILGSGVSIFQSGGNHYDFNGGVDYVAGFSNFIAGYAGAGTNDTDPWFANRGGAAAIAGAHYAQGMARGIGELQVGRKMGIKRWSRNFSAETVDIDIEYTIEEMQDLKMDYGMDALEYGDIIMKNELDQSINAHILGTLFAHGWSNHHAMHTQNGFNLNAFMSDASSTGASLSFLGKDNSSLTIAGPSGVLPSTGAIAENLSTLQRRIISRLLYAASIINVRSLRGKGDQAVVNATIGTAIKDIRGFQTATFDNDIDSKTGLAYMGSLYGIKIYEDPLMDLADNRINISRHGNEKDPGIKFCPYLLAEKVRTIPADTMGTKDKLISRYNVVPAGSNPELNTITMNIQTDSGYSII